MGPEEHPSRCGTLLVLMLVLVGALSRRGAFSWEGIVPMLSAAVLAVALHFRDPFGRWRTDMLLSGFVIASLAAGIYLKAGWYEQTVEYKIVFGGLPIWRQRLNGFGIAIKVLGAFAFMAGLLYLARGRRAWRWAFPFLVSVAIATRVLMPFSSPRPIIDVMVSQTLGAKGLAIQCALERDRERLIEAHAQDRWEAWTLRDSRNVYAMRFPTPYYNERQLGPRLDAEGRPKERAWFDHYGYPPLTVYANALSWLLFRDVRGLWIAFDLLAGLCLYLIARRTNPGEQGRYTAQLATLGFLFMPRSLYVIEQSWTEPLLVATLGVLALYMTTKRKAGWTGLLLGLWLSSKQYAVLAFPAFVRWLGLRMRTVFIVPIAALVGLAIILPMALWDFGAMWHDVFGFFLTSDPRPDAMSLVGMLTRWNIEMPGWLPVPLMLIAIVVLTYKMKRNLSCWCFTAASTWLVFFMLGKQAFMNYFYVIMYALWLAFAAAPTETGEAASPKASGAPAGGPPP